MTFENPLFLCLSLSGVIFVLVGYLAKLFPPKKINQLYGYRTRSSMRSQERWVYAQRVSPREIIRTGFLMLLLSLPGLFLPLPPFPAMLIGISILLLLIVLMFLRVEKAIKRKFPDS